jgi:hypothetical protein
MSEKKALTGLFRDDPATPEGKYLVKRRDGTVVEWPSFVLGARDEFAEIALRAYADAVEAKINNAFADDAAAAKAALTRGWVAALRRMADVFRDYRLYHGDGDPGMGRHRKDDPATIAEMRKGHSA